MLAALMEELIEAAIAPGLPELRGIIVFGSNGSWLVAAPAAEGESMPAMPLFAAAIAAPLVVAPAGCTPPVTGGVVGVVGVVRV